MINHSHWINISYLAFYSHIVDPLADPTRIDTQLGHFFFLFY